jgi:hypothetical protein
MYDHGLTKIYQNVMLNLVLFTDTSGDTRFTRVRGFTQDDAIFLYTRQLDEEFKK